MLQTALKHIKELSSSTKFYVAFLLSTVERKTCVSMARESGKSRYKISRYLEEENISKIKKTLTNTIKEISKNVPISAISIDDVVYIKPHSKKNPGITYDYSGASKRVEKGLTFVTAAWTNGKECIQFDAINWKRKKDYQNEEKYKKKTDILIDLVNNNKKVVPCNFYTFDGAYSSHKILKYFIDNQLNFVGRFPKNRVVIINGKKTNIEKQPVFQFTKNERYKKAVGFYKGEKVSFIAYKRKGKNNKNEIVFFVTNVFEYNAKQVVNAYKHRWPIEKSYRRTKQKIGANDCQSTSLKKQINHLFAVFIVDAIACIHSIYKKNINPDEYINHIRFQKINHFIPKNSLFTDTFMFN